MIESTPVIKDIQLIDQHRGKFWAQFYVKLNIPLRERLWAEIAGIGSELEIELISPLRQHLMGIDP